MANKVYTDQEIATFLELASEIGITRAKRQLGYPHSWSTGQRWVEGAGISVPLDELKAQAAAHNDWYKTEEILKVVQEGFIRAFEALQTEDLDPDQQKKLAEAVQKYSNTWLLLQGKANNINENRKTDSTDIELMELYAMERARNQDIETTESLDGGVS